ncbi:putative pentatricopeptide repeat-containing protein, mitochondrial [Cocos nucifera]|uniref:Putative pentatricopeptide repeat-containing protein, mitochondrial n=1 Tax=Cocos nucifera TaxID=13894 RepID=A0A8K0ITD8_COCNU|nr:putative pentatricopeptide repeat-containing protein, mitochondrial [Cocos nucifera]
MNACDGSSSDAFTYNTYIYIERAGCKPDIETFNTIRAGHAEAGEMGRGRDMMSAILKKGFQWNLDNFD